MKEIMHIFENVTILWDEIIIQYEKIISTNTNKTLKLHYMCILMWPTRSSKYSCVYIWLETMKHPTSFHVCTNARQFLVKK